MEKTYFKREARVRKSQLAVTLKADDRQVADTLAAVKKKGWVSEKNGRLLVAPTVLRRNDLSSEERSLLNALLGYRAVSPDFPRLVVPDGLAQGDPRIAGTRVSVSNIAFLVDAGQGIADILAAYTHLTEEDVREAMRYSLTRRAPVETVAV